MAGAPGAAVFAARQGPAKPSERAYRNQPLNGRQPRTNRARAKIRGRVEPVFATLRRGLSRAWHRCIGLVRNRPAVARPNLVGKLVRLEQTGRLGLKKWKAA